MATLTALELQNYRSISGPLTIDFPSRTPVILVGENNTGKSNVVKGLNLLLGSFWPGNHDPEDHEFFNRDRSKNIRIVARFDPDDPFGGRYEEIEWEFDPDAQTSSYFGHPGRRFIRGDDRDTCVCVILEADRNLSYQLSYGSKYTLLSKLMHKFHKALVQRVETRDELQRLFQEIKERFRDIPEFAEFTGHLRQQLGDFVGSMTHRLEVDFEAYNPTNFFHALRLHAQESGLARTLEEMGTGEQQVLALSFVYAFARAFHGGIVLAIEEPEAHLHPLAQQWLSVRLATLCEGNLQMLITTHSAHFLNLLGLDGVVFVTKDQQGTKAVQMNRGELAEYCIQRGAPAARVTPDNILSFYRSGATAQTLEGFFAKAIVLVEGPTEFLALPVYLNRCGLDHAREGIAIIPVNGKGSLAKWYRLFTAYGIPVYTIFDNDPEDDREGRKREDALRTVGLDAQASQVIIAAEDWRIQNSFSVFGTNFEANLRMNFTEYETLEREAQGYGADSKPFIARWVAENLPLDAEPGWDRFRELAAALGRLAGVQIHANEPG